MAAPSGRAPRIISGTEWLAHKGSVGKIGETAQLRIIGEDGNDVAPGETGEIYFLPMTAPEHLSLSRRRAEASRRRLGIARRYRQARCRRLSLSRRPPRRHDPARRRQHLSGRGRGRGHRASGRALLRGGRPARSGIGPACACHHRARGATDAQAIADGMGDFLPDRLSRYKHPESFETVSVAPRDDSGKVRRTLLRDERAAWMKEGRAFRIMPASAGEGWLRLNGQQLSVLRSPSCRGTWMRWPRRIGVGKSPLRTESLTSGISDRRDCREFHGWSCPLRR